MIDFLIKSTISLLALLIFYHLILEKEKMHRFNRFYLLLGIVFSFALPFITIEIITETIAPIQQPFTYVAQENQNVTEIQETIDYTPILLWSLYALVTSILLFRYIRNILKIVSTIKSNPIVEYKNAKLVLLEGQTPPHTFLNYIFLNKTDYQNRNINKQLYAHELIHVNQKHTLDVLLVEAVKTIFWFNPLFIFYKKAIQLNHEFLADEKVVKAYNDIPFYQNLLLAHANTHPSFGLTSNLNYSITKKRFIMMTTTTPMSRAILKKIALFPLFFALIFFICIEGVAKEKKMPTTINDKTKTYTRETKVAIAYSYSYIGKSQNHPTFKDDLKELFSYMGTNYKTPNNISKSGKIVLTFMIEKDGSLTDLKTVEDIGLGTGAEALRVLKSCPNLTPGIAEGKVVRTPIALQIEVMVLDKKNKITDTPTENIKAINIISEKKDKVQPVETKTTKIQDNEIYRPADVSELPTFPGGIEKFYAFVGKNYKAPKQPNLNGKVYIMFIIEKDGSLSDIKSVKDLGFGTGDEAIRVLKLSPKWTPGEIDGNPVRVLYSLPITINSAK